MKNEEANKSHPLKGVYFCSRCQGDGVIKWDDYRWIQCPSCKGSGFVDWVQNIVRR